MAKIKPGKPKRSPMVRFREKKMEVRDRMAWFLTFLNTDIDSLKTGDFMKLSCDFVEFTYGISGVEAASDKFFSPEAKILIIQSQRFLRKRIKDILTRARPHPDNFRETLESLSYSVPYEIIVSPDRVFKVRPIVWVPFFDENFKGQLFDALVELLSQFDLSRIRTCQKPDCGKYFYRKTTKGEGNFCSPKCQNWARTTRWRRANPDKYNAYQRAYRGDRRDKAKQDRVEVYCGPCGFRESRGFLGDYLKNYSGPQDCPRCKKTKLWHIVTRWDKHERDWVREPYDEKEWNRYLRETQKGEG